MRSSAADNSTQADNSVILAAFSQLLRSHRNLKSTRNPGNSQILISSLVTNKAVHTAAQQLAGDKLVKTSNNNSDFHALSS